LITTSSLQVPLLFYPISVSFFYDATYFVNQCLCGVKTPGYEKCESRNFLTAMFYDTDRDDFTKPLRFALSLQALLIDDPINGDLNMQTAVSGVASGSWNLLPPGGLHNVTFFYPDAGQNMTVEKVGVAKSVSPMFYLQLPQLTPSFLDST